MKNKQGIEVGEPIGTTRHIHNIKPLIDRGYRHFWKKRGGIPENDFHVVSEKRPKAE